MQITKLDKWIIRVLAGGFKTFYTKENSLIQEIKALKGEKLMDTMVRSGVIKSNSEFRRLVKEGAIRIIK